MELKVPNLGENISESNIIAIHLEKGKEIQKDDIILELETDKATLEIPSPDCGIVKEIFSPKLGTFNSICYFEIVELGIIGKLGKAKKIL